MGRGLRWSGKPRQNRVLTFESHERQPPNPPNVDDVTPPTGLPLASARALNINPELLHKWQKEALTPVAAARGAGLDPATAVELRQLRALARRLELELDILKKAIALFSTTDNQ